MPYRHHYDPNQPRVPAGHHDGGQWTRDDAGNIRPIPSQPAPSTSSPQLPFVGTPPQLDMDVLRKAFQMGAWGLRTTAPAAGLLPVFAPELLLAGTIGAAALVAYALYSAKNSRDRRAVIRFRARQYPAERTAIDIVSVQQLDRKQTRQACQKLNDVQRMTDNAAEQVQLNRPGLPPGPYGTAVHTCLRRKIDDLKDPNLQAEVSYLKGAQTTGEEAKVRYGLRKSIRIDVLERAEDGTYCAYDIKTNNSMLGPARMVEIAQEISRVYRDEHPKRIIVTEVRPHQNSRLKPETNPHLCYPEQ